MKSAEAARRKQERLKLFVVPVLVAILAAVLFWPASEDSAPPVATRPSAARAIAHVSTAPAAEPPSSPTSRWPVVELGEITAANPFAKKPATETTPPPAPSTAGNPWLQLASDWATLAGRWPSRSEPQRTTVPPEAADRPARMAPPVAATAATTDADVEPVAPVIDYAAVGQLNAIVHSPRGRFALLDGNRIVREGDELSSGFRIVQISDDKIWVRPLTP